MESSSSTKQRTKAKRLRQKRITGCLVSYLKSHQHIDNPFRPFMQQLPQFLINLQPFDEPIKWGLTLGKTFKNVFFSNKIVFLNHLHYITVPPFNYHSTSIFLLPSISPNNSLRFVYKRING